MSAPIEETRDPAEIEAMFSRIAPRYDLVNRVLSAGRDMAWRRRAVSMADPADDARVLDIGCGTADMMAVVLSRKGFRGHIVGVDLSKPMLEFGKRKLSKLRTEGTYELRQANALELDYPDNRYDLAMATFSVRNLSDIERGFAEVSRLLRPGGRFLATEFFAINREPWFVRLYLEYILPLLGGLISGWRFAYSYLKRSKAAFGTADNFVALGARHGLRAVARRPLTFCVAEIILFEKDVDDNG